MRPGVSIIMPCFNAEEYVETAIESVLKQEVPVELIVIDDQSTDNTGDILARYSTDVNVLQSGNKGVAHARNRAIEHLTGQYTVLLDADDALAPNSLGSLLHRAGKNRNCIVYGAFSSWDRKMKRRLHLHRPVRLRGDPLSVLAYRNISPPGAVMFPTEAFEKVGTFDQAVAGCEDWDFMIRLARAGFSFKPVNKEVFYYRRIPLSASNRAKTMLLSGLEVIRRCHNRDERIRDDLYRHGYRNMDMDTNLFNYHGVCLGIASFSPGPSAVEEIIRTMSIPEKPDWDGFGNAFRLSVWWNSLVTDGSREEMIVEALKRCVLEITEAVGNESWCRDMIKNMLFPDLKPLLFRPGPKKSIRLFKEWRIAREIFNSFEIQ